MPHIIIDLCQWNSYLIIVGAYFQLCQIVVLSGVAKRHSIFNVSSVYLRILKIKIKKNDVNIFFGWNIFQIQMCSMFALVLLSFI